MITNKVLATLKQYNMIQKGSRVLVAFSGGADSTALFHFLYTQQEALGIQLFAAHVNHGLRAESEAEEQEVVNLCKQWNVPLFVHHATMLETEKPKGQSVETWARHIRYTFFEKVARAQNINTIATAHTLNDNAETTLFNLARGTSLKGLGGIPPVRTQEVSGHTLSYIRPLIKVNREEIETYCAANNLPYATDKTNFAPMYARNKIRLQVLPVLQEVNEMALANISTAAEDAALAYSYIAQQAERFLQEYKTENEELPVTKITQLHPALQNEVIAQFVAPYAPLQKTHIALAKACLQTGGKVELAKNIFFVVQNGYAKIEIQKIEKIDNYEYELKEGTFPLPNGSKVRIQCLTCEQYIKICKNDKKLLKNGADCDKIIGTAVLRPRKEGDTFTHPVRGITKTMKKWMNEDKIAPAERNAMPLICLSEKAGNHKVQQSTVHKNEVQENVVHENMVLFYPPAGFCKEVLPGAQTKTVWYISIL